MSQTFFSVLSQDLGTNLSPFFRFSLNFPHGQPEMQSQLFDRFFFFSFFFFVDFYKVWLSCRAKVIVWIIIIIIII